MALIVSAAGVATRLSMVTRSMEKSVPDTVAPAVGATESAVGLVT